MGAGVGPIPGYSQQEPQAKQHSLCFSSGLGHVNSWAHWTYRGLWVLSLACRVVCDLGTAVFEKLQASVSPCHLVPWKTMAL